MSKQDFSTLYEKYLSGQCSDEEKSLLESYYSEIKLLQNDWDNTLGDEAHIKYMIMSKINTQTGFKKLQVINKHPSYAWFGYAASLLLLFSISLFIIKPTVKKQYSQNISPGKSQAYLLLANGRSIVLHNAKNGQIAGSSGIVIKKLNDSMITYYSSNIKVIKKKNSTQAPDSNILTIPRGGIFQTILSDGSKVWLNAASSLKYPVAFAGNERKVVLTGEAYFEVSKNKEMPFKVKVNGMEVKVLGTHFNIKGYAGDNDVKTTLLEGSVNLHSSSGNAKLFQGQQGIYRAHNSGFTVKKVNTADIVAWKDGYFVFNDESIANTMLNLGRWYDVDIIFQNKLNPKNFGGIISRYRSINTVLKALETTGSVHFKVIGRSVVVMD